MTENEKEMINPEVCEMEIGNRVLRKIKIYPLSLADQIKISDLFAEVAGLFLQMNGNEGEGNQTTVILLAQIARIVRENLGKILSLVTDENGDELVKVITNNQANLIVRKIYEVNYSFLSKDIGNLLEKMKNTFPSMKSQQV